MVLRSPVASAVIILAITAAAPPPRPASAAPLRFDFSVPALSGGTLTNGDFKGKIIVVDVWATWCRPCRMVIPHLVKLQEKFKTNGVVVVGLNADDDAADGAGRETVRRFVNQHRINYPVGLMNTVTYVQLARVMGFNAQDGFSIPTTLVMGRNGLVLKRYPGYFPGQEQEIEKLIAGIIESEAAPPKKP